MAVGAIGPRRRRDRLRRARGCRRYELTLLFARLYVLARRRGRWRGRRRRRCGRGCRRRGGSGGNRRGCGGRRRQPILTTVFNGEQERVERHGLAFLDVEREDGPSGGRGNFDDGLVGLHFGDGLIKRDRVAGLDQPAHQLGLDHALAQIGQMELYSHNVVLITQACDCGRMANHERCGAGRIFVGAYCIRPIYKTSVLHTPLRSHQPTAVAVICHATTVAGPCC